MSFDPLLLERILVCTKCRSSLVRDGDALVCVAPDCRLQFSIRHEIPNMLVEEAVAVSAEAWAPLMQRAGRDPVSGAQPGSE
jgi:uncharacterized protein YbaR (Trm112 family)